MSPLNNLKRPQRNKNSLLSTLMISIGLHGVLIFPFWQFRTLELTVPDRPMQLALEIPLTEQVQAVAPPCRQLNKIMLPQAKRVAKPLVKPVAKPEIKAPVPLPEKTGEKAVEIPATFTANAPPPVPKKYPAVSETKPVISEAEPRQTVPAAVPVQAPPGPAVGAAKAPQREDETSAPSGSPASLSAAYLQKIFDKIQKGKRYPRLARDRGIEGAVLLEFILESDGKLVDTRILHSSGFAILDKEALLTLRRAAPFPRLPEGTQAGRVALKVSISFAIIH